MMKQKIYYGWVVVAVCALVLVIMFGIRLSFGVFFIALIDEFGWSRADTSLIFSTTMIVFACTSTASGFFLDRYGPAKVFSVGAFILAVGLALSSQISSLGGLVVAYGIIGGIGVTVLGLTMQASVISRWFETQRGTAIGIAFAGTGVGALLMTPLVEWIIGRTNWRIAYGLLSIFALSLIPLIVIFLRRDPANADLRRGAPEKTDIRTTANQPSTPLWTFGRTVRTPSFWLVMLAGLTMIAPFRMLTVHQLAMMAEVGVPTDLGARIVGVVGASTAVAFVVSGVLSDRFGRIPTYTAGGVSAICGMLLMLTLTGDNTTILWLYAILIGLGEGSRASLVTSVVGDIFSGPTLGAINGTVGASFGIGAAALPWIAGTIFDITASYQWALIIAIITITVSLLALWGAIQLHPMQKRLKKSPE